MTSSKIAEILSAIPEEWYVAAVKTLEVGITTRYYTHSLFSWALPQNNMTVLSFLIEVNKLSHMPNDFFEDDGIFQKIDISLHTITSNIATDYAHKALKAYAGEFELANQEINDYLVLPISHKIGILTDALRNKPIFCIISRNMSIVEEFEKTQVLESLQIKEQQKASEAWKRLLDCMDTGASIYDTNFPERFNLNTVPNLDELLFEVLELELLNIDQINLIGKYPPLDMDRDLAEALQQCTYNNSTGIISYRNHQC